VSRIMRSVFSPFNLRIVFSADGLVPLVNIWRRLRRRILHYMRGPGPKWREKHAHAVSVLSRYR
jgi:hypothetical protein